ncbi:hypothetical protein GXM_02000 [Nostoc sphaeroides CCNUC1]|uniref:Uncharacterized protein n=1 Tax=Nostoc sphaeroides CCNUC1 TaxID=2653204 RepID=A0A5P8VVU3_9NOSO|nr:hypothetical protein GXM_02000 [Nostoc sphaeroides CCNUC1]
MEPAFRQAFQHDNDSEVLFSGVILDVLCKWVWLTWLREKVKYFR